MSTYPHRVCIQICVRRSWNPWVCHIAHRPVLLRRCPEHQSVSNMTMQGLKVCREPHSAGLQTVGHLPAMLCLSFVCTQKTHYQLHPKYLLHDQNWMLSTGLRIRLCAVQNCLHASVYEQLWSDCCTTWCGVCYKPRCSFAYDQPFIHLCILRQHKYK